MTGMAKPRELTFAELAASHDSAITGATTVGTYPKGRASKPDASLFHKVAKNAVRVGILATIGTGTAVLLDNLVNQRVSADGSVNPNFGPGDYCDVVDGRVRHHVIQGESLWQIARDRGVTLEQLAAANDISNIEQHRLLPGADMTLPIDCTTNDGLVLHPMMGTDSDFSIMDPTLTIQERVDAGKAVGARVNSGYYSAYTWSRDEQGNYHQHSVTKFENVTKAKDGQTLATIVLGNGERKSLPIQGVWIQRNPNYTTRIEAKLPAHIADSQVFAKITSSDAIKGANAVAYQIDGIPDLTPVRIIGPKSATFNSLPATLIVVANINGQERTIEVNDPQKILISSQLKESWKPASEPAPDNSVLRDTLIRSNIGVDQINRIYQHYNLPIMLRHFDRDGANFIPYSEGAVASNGNGAITITTGLITDSIFLSDGYPRKDPNGNLLIDHSYQSPANQAREIYYALHERIHDGQHAHDAITKRSEWYNKDPLLSTAFETYTNWMANRGLTPYLNDPNLGRATQGMVNRIAENWGDLIIKRFNSLGIDGNFVLINYGSVGDMRGLKEFYEKNFGKGSFEKTFDQKLPLVPQHP